MNQDAVKVRTIDFWTAVPSLRLLEAVRLAFSLPCLSLSLLANILLQVVQKTLSAFQADSLTYVAPELFPSLILAIATDAEKLLVHGLSASSVALRLTFCFLILGFTGCAVSRSAGFAFCLQRRSGGFRSMSWSAASWRPLMISTGLLCLAGLTGLLVLRCATTVAGWLSISEDLSHAGWLAVWCITIALILGGFVVSIGWLLSLSGLSLDDADGAEALSRGISYVLSNFWRTLCYGSGVLALAGFSAEVTSVVLGFAEHLVSQLSVMLLPKPSSAVLNIQILSHFATDTVRLSTVLTGSTVSYVLLRLFVDNVQVSEAALATSVVPKTSPANPAKAEE